MTIKWLFLIILFVPLKMFDTSVAQDTNSVSCLAYTIYYEANLEPPEGRRAVYEVILERMRRTGKSACEIVLSPKQFSGLTQEKIEKVDEKMLTTFWQIARMPVSCRGCTHFHREDKHPSWNKVFKFRRKISKHLFYEEVLNGT